MITRERLLQMLAEAHEACRLECMSCPWCGYWEHLGSGGQEHYETCDWLKVEQENDLAERIDEWNHHPEQR